MDIRTPLVWASLVSGFICCQNKRPEHDRHKPQAFGHHLLWVLFGIKITTKGARRVRTECFAFTRLGVWKPTKTICRLVFFFKGIGWGGLGSCISWYRQANICENVWNRIAVAARTFPSSVSQTEKVQHSIGIQKGCTPPHPTPKPPCPTPHPRTSFF